MFGVGANDAMVADPNRYFNLSKADLVVANKCIQSLYHDLTYVFEQCINSSLSKVKA